MRPFKHVAPIASGSIPARFQNILGIETARFRAPKGDVPIVATSEFATITLFAWNDATRQWASVERPHEHLTTDAIALEDPNGWNWSRRVSVACSDDTVFLVYKRQHVNANIALTVDRFRFNNGALQFVDTLDLPMPRNVPLLGFNVWADVDPVGGRLLVLFQGAGIFATHDPRALFLYTLPLDDLGNQSSPTPLRIDSGGHDLDARLDGRKLLAVYRRDAAAVRFPPPVAGPFNITSGPEADQFYPSLFLATIDLDAPPTNAVSIEELPGGEHPQIQSVAPLIITFDRELRTTISFDTVVLPLPPHQRRVVWQPTFIDKVAIIRRAEGDARGVVLRTTAHALPRAFFPFGPANHLIAVDNDAFGHAMPLGTFPVQLVQFALHRKEIVLDFLHHLAFIALVRTRVTGATTGDTLAVADSVFELWDIGHSRIGPPEGLQPDAEAENRQFLPVNPPHATASLLGLAAPWQIDGTMGGHVAADLRDRPASLFAYTDMGDGGLRVIFGEDVGPLRDPPPYDDTKSTLPPESVTGPPASGEKWIQVDANGFIDCDLPFYSVAVEKGFTGKSLGSSLEVPLDSLMDAIQEGSERGLGPGGTLFVSDDGMTEAQVNVADAFIETQVAIFETDIAASDGNTVHLTINPGKLVEGQPLTFTATVGGVVSPLAWGFVHHEPGTTLPDGPLSPFDPSLIPAHATLFATTNPAIITFGVSGRWRLSLFLSPANPGEGPRTAVVELSVDTSANNLVWALHDQMKSDNYDVGNLHATFLQYDFQFTVTPEGERSTVAIKTLVQRATQMRFRADGNRQGIVDCRAKLVFESNDIRLKGALALAFAVEELHLEMVYTRPFTPGMLMTDRRALDVLTGEDLGHKPDNTTSRTEPLHHAALAAKPIGDGVLAIAKDANGGDAVVVKVGARPEAVATTIIAALAVIGASALIEVILGALGLAAVAVAIGLVAAVALAAALLVVLLLVIAPLFAEGFVKTQIVNSLPAIKKGLDDRGFIRYSGEGLAEAIARKVFDSAAPGDVDVAPAATTSETFGLDRFRGQTMQVVFVSDKLCRVLLQPDE